MGKEEKEAVVEFLRNPAKPLTTDPKRKIKIACSSSLEIVASILEIPKETAAVNALAAFSEEIKDCIKAVIPNSEAHLFAHYYKWFSEKQRMKSTIESLGFDHVFFERCDENPRNKRKHATIIRAKKATEAAAAASAGPVALDDLAQILSRFGSLEGFGGGSPFAFTKK